MNDDAVSHAPAGQPGANTPPLTPGGVIARLTQQDPKLGRFINLILGIPAIAAIAAAWGVDAQTAGLAVLWFGAVAAVLALFARLFADDATAAPRVVLSWFMVCCVIGATCVLALSAIWRPAPFGIAPVECLVRFWERCDTAQDAVAARNHVPVSAPAAPVPAPAPVQAGAVVPANYSVRLNFNGSLLREDIIATQSALADAGWQVERGQRGGRRTTLAAGLNEVRYAHAEDAAAAAMVARFIQARGVVSGRITPRLTPGLDARLLDVWISR